MTRAEQQEAVFVSPKEKVAARKTLEVIRRQYEKLPQSKLLLGSDVQNQIAESVRQELLPKPGEQEELEGLEEPLDVEGIVAKTTEALVKHTIDIPRVVVVPKGDVNYQFDDFDLDTSGISLQPVSEDILIQHLATHARHYLSEGSGVTQEVRLEDYLVRGLVDYDDISYDHHADLLYKLAGQVVAHLQGYLSDEKEVLNVLQYHQRSLSELIHSQMQSHYQESVMEYEAKVSRGAITLNQASYSVPADEKMRDYREAPAERSRIRDYLFGGFSRCLYPTQRFHSDPERQFAVLLENEKQELKWFKPAERQFQIHFNHEAPPYEPDFVVETAQAKYLCEPKRADQMQSEEVQAKARAAVKWCEYASAHEVEHGGKPWKYLLIPHDAITATVTLQGLEAKYALG